MEHVNVKRAGFAFGFTGALLYAGCALLMLIVGHSGTEMIFNSLLHGLDVSTITRMNVPLGESIIGWIATFLLGWLVGACIAWIYNMCARKGSAE